MAKTKVWVPKLKRKKIVINGNLRSFVKASINTTSRELFLRWRFLYDVSIAAGHAGYALQTFLPDVDREGIDVVLSDADTNRPIQLKATANKTTPSFMVANVHCGALRPSEDVAHELGFEPTVGGSGQHGCIVLIEIFNIDLTAMHLDIRYWITDAYILAALADSNDLVPGAPPEASRDAQALIQILQRGTSHDRVDVRRTCFVPAASAGALLTLASLHSHAPFQNLMWQYILIQHNRHFSLDEDEALLRLPNVTPKQARDNWRLQQAKRIRDSLAQCLSWPARAKKSKT